MTARRTRTRSVVVPLLLALALAGCTGEPSPSAPTPTTEPPTSDPTVSGTPDGAPLVTGDPSSTPDDESEKDEKDDEDDKDEDKGKDEDEDDRSATGASPFPDWMTRPTPDDSLCGAATVTVSDADALQEALDDAGPGTVIGLEPGVYEGEFVTTASGSDSRPAALCGPTDAILDGGGPKGGYVLHLDGAEHWVLSGFTVRNGQKGVMADGTTGTTISGLTVFGIGDEAVHLRGHSTDNLVVANTISDTGLRKPKFGEGVYIGTAHSNWCDVTDCDPDTSDNNRVVDNAIYATSSEGIDIKEGTSDGVVEGNQLDGSEITGADSWVDVKGNDWTITGNVGRASPLDGFQTHDVYDGWGTRNVFSGNSGSLDDDEGVLIALRPVNENRVRCTNDLLGSTGEESNVECR